MTDEEKVKIEEFANQLREKLQVMKFNFNEPSEEELSAWYNDLRVLYQYHLDHLNNNPEENRD